MNNYGIARSLVVRSRRRIRYGLDGKEKVWELTLYIVHFPHLDMIAR